MRSYETSRTLFGILEFICWAAIVVGGIMLVVGISALTNARYGIGPQAVFAVPGLILPLAGLMGVVLVQTARAAVDTAELTGQILHVSRDQLEVSKQSLRQSEALEKGFEALKSARPLESPKADFATMQPRPTIRTVRLAYHRLVAVEQTAQVQRTQALKISNTLAGKSYVVVDSI